MHRGHAAVDLGLASGDRLLRAVLARGRQARAEPGISWGGTPAMTTPRPGAARNLGQGAPKVTIFVGFVRRPGDPSHRLVGGHYGR